jgi:cytochrome c biogenesis protein CcdA
MLPKTRSIKKYVIFPCCLLVFGALEEVVVYKSDLITNDYLRVAALMVFYAFGISLLAFSVTPFVEKLILQLHAVTKVSSGRFGEYLFVLLLLAGVYFLWYQILVHGPESLLPEQWR